MKRIKSSVTISEVAAETKVSYFLTPHRINTLTLAEQDDEGLPVKEYT